MTTTETSTDGMIRRWSRRLLRRASEIRPLAKQVVRKPMILGHVLLTARQAQIITVIALLVSIFVVPPVVKKTFRTVIPQKQSSELFGLIKKDKPRPIARGLAKLVVLILWAGAAGASVMAFWLYIPTGVESAQRKSHRREQSGDEFAGRDVYVARSNYKRAIALEYDPRRLSQLQEKLRSLVAPSRKTPSDDGTPIHELSAQTRSDFSPLPETPTNSRQQLLPIVHDGRYEIRRELGRGAMGVVYLAHDGRLQRAVALKELPTTMLHDSTSVARFKQEALAMAQLSHPNILQVYDLLEDDGRMFMVLEFVDGGDLGSRIEKSGGLSVGEGIRMVAAIAEGLACAHQAGIVHRDLKPQNILLASSGIPKIADFGIARLAGGSRLTQDGSAVGSPEYMSPEQISGNPVDERADIYALGMTLYELLTGRLPFSGDLKSILSQQLVKAPAPPSEFASGVPEAVDELVLEMLAKDPGRRISDAQTVIGRLQWLLSDTNPACRSGRKTS